MYLKEAGEEGLSRTECVATRKSCGDWDDWRAKGVDVEV